MIYDVLVIGGGPAGYRAAERAGHLGMTVAIFEKRALGGVCLNEGCIPTKTLLHSAKLYDYAKGGAKKYGVSATDAKIDHSYVIDRKNKVVKTLVSGVAMQMKHAKAEVVKGEAVIKSKSASGFVIESDGKTFEGRNVIIASGSSAAVPPIAGLADAIANGIAMTNREILDLREVPSTLAVMGGGVIGLEMASYFNSIGTDVTVIEMLDRIGGRNDRDMTDILKAEYEKRGVKFMLSTKVTAVSGNTLEIEHDGKKSTVNADKILVSVGRRANTANMGFEALGVFMERGAVKTDEKMRTNIPGIYAAGDVNGVSMLAHTAYREAEVAVNVIAGKNDFMSYDAIPGVIYTNPELSSVGETSETASEKGIKYREIKLPMQFSGRYIAENEGGNGIMKLILDADGIIIGCAMIGNPSSEIIPAMAMAIERRLTCGDISKIVFPHPTVAEVIREAAMMEVK